jgi:tetratricopeptide (TPR) repeat protein
MARAREVSGTDDDPREVQEWVRVDDLRDEASSAVERGRDIAPGASAPAEIETEVREELARAVGATRAPRLEQRLKDASRAFRAERFTDAARILSKLVNEAPSVPPARELYGLTLYRQGKWRQAAKELEAFRLLSGSTEQHPVLADCYRALGDDERVLELWDELREASPNADLVTEGRIVVAGMQADRGRLDQAIRLLEQGWKLPRHPQERHLRRAYALADLYERSGDVSRARELFGRLATIAPDLADVTSRRRSLG